METINEKLSRAVSLLTEIQDMLKVQTQFAEKPLDNSLSQVKITPPVGGRFAWKYYIKMALEEGQLNTSANVAVYVAKCNNEAMSEEFKRRTSQVLGEMYYKNEVGRVFNPHVAGYQYGKMSLFIKGNDGRFSILKKQ